jgi:hypothetical protein
VRAVAGRAGMVGLFTGGAPLRGNRTVGVRAWGIGHGCEDLWGRSAGDTVSGSRLGTRLFSVPGHKRDAVPCGV